MGKPTRQIQKAKAKLQRGADKKTANNYLNTNFLLSTDKATPESEYPKNLTPSTYFARLDWPV